MPESLPAAPLPLTCRQDFRDLQRLGVRLGVLPMLLCLPIALWIWRSRNLPPQFSVAWLVFAVLAQLLPSVYLRCCALLMRKVALEKVELQGEALRYSGRLADSVRLVSVGLGCHLGLRLLPGLAAVAHRPLLSALVAGGCAWLAAAFADFYGTRYRLQQTMWHGHKFDLLGDFSSYLACYCKGSLLALCTLGVQYPAYAVNIRRNLYARVRWQGHALHYAGDAKQVSQLYYKGIGLSLVTCGLYLPWHWANLINYHRSALSLGGVHCRSFQDGRSLGWLALTNLLLFVGSLGLAMGYVAERTLRYEVERLELLGAVPVGSADVETLAEQAPRVGGLSDAFSSVLFLG